MKIKQGSISLFCTACIAVTVFLGVFLDTTVAGESRRGREDTLQSNDRFYYGLHLLERTLQRVYTGYVEDIDEDSLIRGAIDGALDILDPYTTFYEPKEYEELRVRTEGEFGGLGIQISIRDDVLTVMTPIAGTPAERAGIRSGDQIVKIDGESTEGISLENAVDKMRGEPGTDVTITISRSGETEPVDYTITRDIIEIRAIPYAGILKDAVGYVRLSTFSSVSADSVRNRVDQLVEEGAQGLIVDLRSNPGGLLEQAVSVADVFLPANKKVVYTQGRIREGNREFFTQLPASIPDDMPLVVLVNRASASASEIVAGAIQDWDRGIVLGETTFGKGSVQTVLPIDRTENRFLKLTTSYYHTPSGRSINRPHDMDVSELHPDSLEIEIDSSKVYRTKRLERKVFGGGGIVPDTIVETREFDAIIRSLLVKDLFFKFANYHHPLLEEQGVDIGETFTVSDELFQEFLAYADSVGVVYESSAGRTLDSLKAHTGLDHGDTSKVDEESREAFLRKNISEEDAEEIRAAIDMLESVFQRSHREAIRASEEEIREKIRMALLVREKGQDNPLIHELNIADDQQVNAALDILRITETYRAILEQN
ncbi:S41 family peptidase [Chitinivibrio alkaliphilus]|uniref:Carboxyl-terminal protease n=1 Tax=Chitinivibrio alkaliphilus ACht1 TaxID=1313304 RepID=U7D8V1_9BACT|nr:S41 family peptidase [Chitinivibrio alkaliphilus]ERP32011.1 carboxyl-terminal protease [Chitinivibrio alkaliphilus ACht1]